MADEALDAQAKPLSSSTAQDSGSSTLYPFLDTRVILAGILIFAAWLRFAGLGHNSLTFDEMYLLRIALSRWQDIPAMLRTGEFHPPAFYLLTKAWLSVAPDLSDATVRMLPAFLSVLSVCLTYIVMRRLTSEPTALLSALLVAASPFSIMAGQELRMYPLVTVLFLASTYGVMNCFDRTGWAWWALYVVLTTALLYTHYLGFFLLLGQGAWVAWLERRRLGSWVVAVLVIAALYAPWIPALIFQRAHGVWWIGEGSPLQYAVQLLGLLAFGGSLFGMPDYHYVNTALKPIEQLIVLLPFVVVLGVGVGALMFERHRFGLVAVPSALALSVPLLLTLGRANVAARWYSFLAPVYALCIARGVVGIAQRVRGQQRSVMAGATISLLLYSSAVLSHYYLDANFALYHWRERAAQVKAQVQPGDGFVYGIRLDAVAFTYYFGSAYPGMVLFPAADLEKLRRFTAPHPRVWLVIAPPATEAMLKQAIGELQKTFPYVTSAPGGDGKPTFPIVYLFRSTI
jgi:uncharacterized membrane protein